MKNRYKTEFVEILSLYRVGFGSILSRNRCFFDDFSVFENKALKLTDFFEYLPFGNSSKVRNLRKYDSSRYVKLRKNQYFLWAFLCLICRFSPFYNLTYLTLIKKKPSKLLLIQKYRSQSCNTASAFAKGCLASNIFSIVQKDLMFRYVLYPERKPAQHYANLL